MEAVLNSADKEVLVTIVKKTQKNQTKGAKGTWKEFLNFHDRKMGSCVSDPAKRSVDDLLAFLKTFSEKDLQFFANILRCDSNRKKLGQQSESPVEQESSQEKLVRLTVQHPEYLFEYSFPSSDKDWVIKKLRTFSKATSTMISVDCEMVLCEDGTEALVQVCVVDQNLEIKFNQLVNPNKAVADYRTEITGISAKDLEGVTCSLGDIQQSMKKLLRDGTILIGHALSHDLKAMKVDYARVIDTAYIFMRDRRRPSLNYLCQSILGYKLRKEGAPHNCQDDAQAAMKLVHAKLKLLENAARNEAVLESDLGKLLLHRIPIDVPHEELHRIFPDFKFELLPFGRTKKYMYGMLATFKDPQEAREAFESIKSKMEKDTNLLPQKLVTFELSTGLAASLYVRKMTLDDDAVQQQDSSKCQVGDTEESKKRKLLLHRIPVDLPHEELHRIFPDFKYELLPFRKSRKNRHSFIATFKDPQEAHEAFESIKSKKEKDTNHLPQKRVTFELSTGLPASLYVRKMASDDDAVEQQVSSKKRSLKVDVAEESKKRKTELHQCEEHVKEIESLEQKLRERDEEILRLQKIVSALTRKQGL